MLSTGKVRDIQAKACYCCSTEGRVAFVVEAASRDAVLEAMEKFDIPVASIMDAEEVPVR